MTLLTVVHAWQLNIQSPHRNSAFQKLFTLPPEEFLINDFSCYLKRKMPLQVLHFAVTKILFLII